MFQYKPSQYVLPVNFKRIQQQNGTIYCAVNVMALGISLVLGSKHIRCFKLHWKMFLFIFACYAN